MPNLFEPNRILREHPMKYVHVLYYYLVSVVILMNIIIMCSLPVPQVTYTMYLIKCSCYVSIIFFGSLELCAIINVNAFVLK